MFDEQWPDEPNEPDPGERWGDPERDLPRIPSAPTPPDPSENEVSGEVARAFWAAVVLVNVGLFALSLGPLLAVFRGRWALGTGLFALGCLSIVHAYRVYRRFRRSRGGRND